MTNKTTINNKSNLEINSYLEECAKRIAETLGLSSEAFQLVLSKSAEEAKEINQKHKKTTKGITRTADGKNDECYTPRYAVEPLLEFLELHRNLNPNKKIKVWCPFSTENSEFVKVLQEHGYDVVYSHLDYGQDFFQYEPEEYDVIIDNPPFTGKHLIFKRLYSFKKPFALVMDVRLLNDPAPMRTFKENGLELLLFDDRIQFKNQPDGAINFACGYFCKDFLPEKFLIRDFKSQPKLSLSYAQ